jgi:hypothetical protein
MVQRTFGSSAQEMKSLIPCDATEKFRLQGSHDPRPPLKRSQNVPKPELVAGQLPALTAGLVPERGRFRPFCALFEGN